MLTGLLVILLVAFMIYLERRLSRLERLIAETQTLAPSDERPEDQAFPERPLQAPEPTLAAQPPEQAVVEPSHTPAILYAEQRPPADVVSEGPEPTQRRPFAFSIEDLFGRRLPIWAGGITLAVAGMFIVKLSIEAGLLSPPVRVIAGTIFGAALIGSAELALRYHQRVGDVRVRQALSGAGIATLYASILVAASLYHLVSPLIAMLGLAGVTGAAMLLAIRFGAPSALLGLAGGLAAPALIGSAEPNVPLLTLYLALAVGGLTTLSRNQRWAWLGIGALIGGFGWGIALLLEGALDAPSSLSLGLYILLLGIGLPALGFAGDRRNQLQLVAGILAAAQMAALVATGGFTMLNWGLFASIAAAAVWLAAREPKLQQLPAVSLVVALLLAGAWPDPSQERLAVVLSGIALIHGFMPLRRLWSNRGGLLDAAQLAAIALGGWLLPMLHFYRPDDINDVGLGLLAAGLGLVAGAIAAAGWRYEARQSDARFAIVATCAALLLSAAATLLLPAWIEGVAIAFIGLALLHLGQLAEDRRFEPLAWIFAAAGLIACFTPDAAFDNVRAIDSLRFALIFVVSALFAWRGRFTLGRWAAQFAAALFLYFAAAPWIDDRLDPAFAALILVAAAWASRGLFKERLLPAMAAATLVIAGWALPPISDWTLGASASLAGYPLLVQSVPTLEAALTRLLVPGILTGTAVWLALPRLGKIERACGFGLAAILCAIGIHSLYKNAFAIGSSDAFVALGLAERTLWEALLLVGAAAAVRFGWRRIALGLAVAALLHFAGYTLLLHNPLWAAQSVGSLPIFNLLLPAYVLPLAVLAVVSRYDWIEIRAGLQRAVNIAQMVLIALLAFSLLRQAFHGPLLTEAGVTQPEDIGRSLLAIVLAGGFLLWGIARQDRDWRIGSLVLMLAAVGKVFLLDAAGLEGLTRIGSFIALGLSLIGIGWLYARFIPGGEAQVAKAGSRR